MLSDKAYNVLKWIALLFMPSLATFIGVVGKVWGMENVDAWVTTINAVGIFIGAIIGVSNTVYNKTKETDNEGN